MPYTEYANAPAAQQEPKTTSEPVIRAAQQARPAPQAEGPRCKIFGDRLRGPWEWLEGCLHHARLRAAMLLRTSVGLIYLWFALPKLVPGLSPAEPLVDETTSALTFGLVEGRNAVVLTALLEIGIGLLVLCNRWPRATFILFLGHMAGTTAPLLLLPEQTWNSPMTGTLEGQYILKNIVLIAALTIALALRHPPATAQPAAVRAGVPEVHSTRSDTLLSRQP